MVQPLLIVFATLVTMEFAVAKFHQYIMHGIGWKWHESHHVSHEPIAYSSADVKTNPPDNRLEKNDLYALVFSLATLLLFIFSAQYSAIWWIGVGISLYGFLYALMHDVIVHRRLRISWQPRKAYLKRLIKAHNLHHAVRAKDNSVSFGFLYAPPLHTLHAKLRVIKSQKALAEITYCKSENDRLQRNIPASNVSTSKAPAR